MTVYLLHYTKPLPRRGTGGARHYIGYTEQHYLLNRLDAHKRGTSGAALPTAFAKAGIPFVVARIWWEGTRALERYLKKRGHFERECVLCQPTLNLPPMTQALLQASAVRKPYGQRTRKRTKANGGVSLPGTPTSNATPYLPGLSPATSIGSGTTRVPVPATTGSNASAATVPLPRQVGGSAGIRLRSPSGGLPSARTVR